MNSAELWQTIDRAGIIWGFIVSVPLILSFFILVQDWYRKRTHIKKIRKQPGNRPTVLIVDVRKPDAASIRAQVENYLRSSFDPCPFTDETIFVAEFRGEMNNEDVDIIMADVRKMIGKCAEYGTDKIHLFIRCPVTVAATVGEFLSNFGAPVVLHHNQPNKGYENWGLLHR